MTRRPHLVLCCLTLGDGGAEVQVLRLAEHLYEDFRITILTGKPQPRRPELPAGVEWRCLSPNMSRVRRLMATPGVVRECRKLAPDLIYSAYVNFNLALARARDRGTISCPVILQEFIQPSDFFRDSWILSTYGKLMRRYYGKADLTLGNGTRIVEDLVENYQVPVERCRYLPYAAPKVEINFSKDTKADAVVRLLAVGRLTEQKAFDLLLRAFGKVRRTAPCKLTILGEGELRGALEKQARELQLDDDFSLPGYDPEPMKYYADADVFVLSSHYEGMANVLIEAMTARLGIAATDVSGTRDLLRDGEEGLIVPIADLDALISAMERLVSDAALRKRLGEAAGRRIEEFTPEKVIPLYADTFRELIEAAS